MKLMQLKEPDEVFTIIREHFQALPAITLSLYDAAGLCPSEAVSAPEDIPGFDRSTVDGYALRAADTFGASGGMPALLPCSGEIDMGRAAPPLPEDHCLAIHTGAMLPAGADAVIMLEDTEVSGNMVQVLTQVAPGQNVIHRGEDLKQGTPVLKRGHPLRAPEIGLLSSLGLTSVTVHPRPRVTVLSSGDELVSPAAGELALGQIRDSNGPALAALAAQLGAVAEKGGILPDRFDDFLDRSREMLSRCDLLVFSGGSSVGSRDYTARTMEALGEPGLLVEGIALQPGKPTLLANCGSKAVLGLPGHPVSALTVFSLFGRAIIDRLGGKQAQPWTPTIRATLERSLPSRSGRTDYVRVKLRQEHTGVVAVPVFGRSGMLRTLAEADGLVVVPREAEGLHAGTAVEVVPWL